MRFCEKCKKPRPTGRGRRYCNPCSIEQKHATSERAMEKFKAKNPDYWKQYHARKKGGQA